MARTRSPEPSDKQLELFRFILAFLEQNCFQPSQAEMALHFGITKNAITERLKELQSRGMVTMPTVSSQRAIRLNFVKCKVVVADDDHPGAKESDNGAAPGRKKRRRHRR